MIERLFVLKRTEVFRDLPEPVLVSLSSYLEETDFDAGEEIFRQGEIGKSIYIVVQGTVRVHDGERDIGTIGENEVFGERSALTARVHGASATADTDCKLLRLDQDLLYEVMASNPEVSRGIIKVLLERFQ